MIEHFEIKNLYTNESMTFGFEEEDFLIDENSLSWGTVNAVINTYNFPEQIGFDISNSRLLDRQVKITGYVWANIPYIQAMKMTEKQYYQESEKIIELKKKKLNALINPLNDCEILLKDFHLTCRPSSTISYSSNLRENNEIMCKFTIQMYCVKPLWKANKSLFYPLVTTVGLFHFPLTFRPKGIQMGVRTNYSLIAVTNNGDVTVGAKIILKARGQVINPVVENVYTGEYMRLLHTMQENEIIEINTSDDELTITGIIDEEQYDYVSKWDFNSDFIQFQKGFNVLGYSADDETYTNLEISMELNESLLEVQNA